MDRSDAELLVASSAGSAEAYSVFFRRHADAITRYAVRRCAGPDDVADLVGECFLVALQAAHRYVPETDTALPWLFGIARRLLAKQRRKYAGNRRLEIKVSNAFPAFTAAEDDAIASAIDAAMQAPASKTPWPDSLDLSEMSSNLSRMTGSARQRLQMLWISRQTLLDFDSPAFHAPCSTQRNGIGPERPILRRLSAS